MLAERAWPLAFAAYVVAQAALRLLIGPALELDEAEALWHARTLAWGYGPQPPLYFWLQWTLFQALGEGLLALAVLKAALLWGTLALTFRLLRPEVGAGAAGVAALSLGLLPQVAWEGQRALTHSVLALLMAALVAHLLVRALRSGRWGDHLLLGAAAGFACLAKFNVALWPAGLLLAAAALPEWRRHLRPRPLLAAGAVAVAVIAPPAVWIAANPVVAMGSAGKLDLAAPGALAARLEGTAALLRAAVGFLALPTLVLGGVLAAARVRPARTDLRPASRLLATAAGMGLLVLWLGVLAAGATAMRERWLLPLLWPLPPVAVAALWPRLGPGARRAVGGIAGGAWLLAAAALPYASLVDPGYRGADFGPLAARLSGEAGPILVTDQWLAGNLALRLPEADLRLADGAPAPDPAVLLVAPSQDLDAAALALGLGPPAGREAVPVPMARGGLVVAVARVAP